MKKKGKLPKSRSRTSPLRLGISGCLLGEACRYDGASKPQPLLRDLPGVEWVPVCPEVEVGMPVPREPIELQGDASRPRLVGVRSGADHTDDMRAWAEARLEVLAARGLDAFVVKARSPSCALRDAPVHEMDHEEKAAARGPGMFTAALLRRLPRMPVADEEELLSAGALGAFLERVERRTARPAPDSVLD